MTYVFDPSSPDPDHAGTDDLDQIKENFNALRGAEAGAAEPSNPVAGMKWLDTSGSPYVLKIRNEANSAWLSLLDLNADGMLKAHIADEITDVNEVHGIVQGTGGGFDADTVDGHHYVDLPSFGNIPDGLYDNLGDEIIKSLDTERSTTSLSYVLKKEWLLNKAPGASIRIQFKAKKSNLASTGYAQIFRDDVAVGTERVLTTEYQTFTETLSGWADDQRLQLKAKAGASSATYVKEFRILGSKCVEESYDA